MGRLIKFELIKMFKQISFYICGGCILLFSVLSVCIGIFTKNVFGDLVSLFGEMPSGYKYTVSAINSCNYTVILAIVICIGICVDYSRKTFKNIWARGFTRTQVFIAKEVSAVVAALIYGISSMLVSFALSSIVFGVGNNWDGITFVALLMQLVICVAFASVFVSIAFFVKNLAAALVISILGVSLVSLGATIIELIGSFYEVDIQVKQFLLTENLTRLSSYYTITVDNICMSFLCSVGFIATFMVCAWLKLRKDEL